MPSRPLPNNPSLEHLRKDAKRLRAAVSAGAEDARGIVKEFHPRADRAVAHFTLADAQLVTARSYGFTNWAKLWRSVLPIKVKVQLRPSSRCDLKRSSATNTDVPTHDLINSGQHHGFFGEPSWLRNGAERTSLIWDEQSGITRDFLRSKTTGFRTQRVSSTGNIRTFLLMIPPAVGN